jgi:hypothetical protein
MLRPRPAPSHHWSSWLLVLVPRGPGRRRRRPTEAWPQLLGQHLDGRSGAAVLSGPGALLSRPTTTSITLDTYGHLFPSEMDTLGDRLELSATWPWPGWDGPSADRRTTAWTRLQVDDLIARRRLRGSNPRGSCPPTRFPGVCLRPLGQASAGQSSQPRNTRPPDATVQLRGSSRFDRPKAPNRIRRSEERAWNRVTAEGGSRPAAGGCHVARRRRQGWDSNPWMPCDINGFRDRPIRPLWHLAVPEYSGGG